MKKLIPIFLVFVACSPHKEENQVPFPIINQAEDEWAFYEGKIITDDGFDADMELSLKQAAVGIDSYFKLKKSMIHKGEYYSWDTRGKYSVSYGLPHQEQGITLIDPSREYFRELATKNIIKTSQSENFTKKLLKQVELLAAPETYFKTDGNERLILTNRNFNERGLQYVLHRRSDLFTVEGYVTCEDSVTEFFERNTSKNWKVAPLGQMDSVKIKYIELATEMHEGIYLKALAYSIADTTSESNKSLVIKHLLKMAKSDLHHPIK